MEEPKTIEKIIIEKQKLNFLPIVLAVVIGAVFFGFIGYTLGKNYNSSQSVINSVQPLISPTVTASAVSTNCAKEGEQVSQVFTEYPSQCCTGLSKWDSGMDTREVVDGICKETGLLSGLPVGTCLKLNDGICSSIENICNSPNDCK